MLVPRTIGSGAYSYLARSVDGGRTFGPARRISGGAFAEAVNGPNGSVALVDGPTTTRAGLFAADGSSARSAGAELGPYLEGVFTDIAGATAATALEKSQQLVTRYRGQVDGVFAPNESSTFGMLRALEGAGMLKGRP